HPSTHCHSERSEESRSLLPKRMVPHKPKPSLCLWCYGYSSYLLVLVLPYLTYLKCLTKPFRAWRPDRTIMKRRSISLVGFDLCWLSAWSVRDGILRFAQNDKYRPDAPIPPLLPGRACDLCAKI